jgi:Leucine-rich repeat (LRR) protein
MREVNELILRGNKFDSFLDCSTKLDSLRILDLSYNNLKKFFFLCIEESNLVSLNVSHNQIEYINDEALNHRVMKLKILDVSFNDLYVVNDTMLQHMKVRNQIILSYNSIIVMRQKLSTFCRNEKCLIENDVYFVIYFS